MFFILSKILSTLLSPFLWVLLLWLLFVYVKGAKPKKILFWLSISLSILFSNGLVIRKFIELWEVPGTRIDELKTYDYGIVLSGMFEYNRKLNRLSARRGSDRLWQAIHLYHKGKIKRIILSGDSGYVFNEGLHEANQLKSLLIEQNIPASDILIENKSRNTHENAKETVKILKERGLLSNSFILITSAIHMHRAAGCFKKEGLDCATFSTDHYDDASSIFSPNSIIPSAEAFIMWKRMIKEWIGTIMYRLFGFI
tara:strand:+ start:1156 stop:1920 length:765 start_codon:yes stop_codon:yes gene_type:complete